MIQIHGIIPSLSNSDQGPCGQNGTSSGANGAARPRVRARRGQATDPHSIAERVCMCVGAFLCMYLLRLYAEHFSVDVCKYVCSVPTCKVNCV